MDMWLLAFLTGAIIDSIPLFAPPSWIALLFLLVRFKLDLGAVVLFGVAGSTLGRFILSTYIHLISDKILGRHEEENIRYLGKRLGHSRWSCFVFVLVYCLTPLSTTALFTAAGMAGVKRRFTLPPFFVGKLASYTAILYAGQKAAGNITDFFRGKMSWASVSMAGAGVLMVVAMLFVDWKPLLEHGKLRLDFKIWS